jgi:hypothetical protein
MWPVIREGRARKLGSEGTKGAGEGPENAAASDAERPAFDTSVAHIARVYDYWLGGKDNFAADRAAAEQAIAAYPDIVFSVRANRAFLAHARALLTSGPHGVTSYLDADLRDTQRVLTAAAETLDFSRPVAVMLMAILQHVDNAENPYGIVETLLDALPPGSHLALSHPAADIEAEAQGKLAERLNQTMAEKVTMRDRAQVLRFFDGLELVEPGLVRVPQWRPASEAEASSPAGLWGGVGRKN